MPTTITALPPAPSRADPTTFSSKADTFVAALPTMVTEINALSLELNTASSDAISSAATATTQAGIATTQAGIATSAANSAINSPATTATSTTSLTIGNGTKTFTIQTGKGFVVGQSVVIASQANPLNQMVGVITAHDSVTGAMTVVVQSDMYGGSGTYSDWSVALTVSPFATTYLVNQAALIAATNATDLAFLFLLSFSKKV